MNKRLMILVLIATMVLLGFVGSTMATKPVKVKGEVTIPNFTVADPDGNPIDKFSGTARFIIHGMLDSNGQPVRIQIHLGVEGEAQDKDYRIRGALNANFPAKVNGSFTCTLPKTFTCIPAGEGANFKVDLTVNVTGDINDPATIAVTLRQQR